MTDFLPRRQSDLDAWEANFTAKVSAVATTLAVPAATVTAVTTSITAHRLAYANAVKGRADAQALNEKNALQEKQTATSVRALVKQLKASPAFTTDMGKSLGIEGGTDAAILKVEEKPTLITEMRGGEIVIKFKKHGFDGIKLYSKRGTESAFTFLAIDTVSPYNDSRPNLVPGTPEKREYYAYFLDKDDAVGTVSDSISIMA